MAQNASQFAGVAKPKRSSAPLQHQLMVCASSGAVPRVAKPRVYHPLCQVIAC